MTIAIMKLSLYSAGLVAWAWLGVHLWHSGMEPLAALIAASFGLGVYMTLRMWRAARST